ncbi:MAG: DUF2277 domain-containing protein [Alphaproteobacteria bacterium]|nr:DUF2277 domain-containing protein [Alphaproteobacteria bacterium]MCB9700035.1 DUF2277 domain-containing protein [Alphaproteobacteria bacterium]
MCRNIRLLHNFDPPATDEEIRASALQYVRKVSGVTNPSRANVEAFDRAVEEITAIATRLIREELTTSAPPRSREVEAERAKERGRQRDERMRKKVLAELEGA